MTNINKRMICSIKEDAAVNYLANLGHTILTRNFWTKYGEIDIISEFSDTIVFTEVKYRDNISYGYPEEAVTLKKQHSIQSAALFYISKNKLSLDKPYRFDVIVIIKDNIKHIENAF